MPIRPLLVIAFAVLATACVEQLQTPEGRYGSVTAPTYDAGGGNYVIKPEAVFYDNTDVGYVPFIGDTCILAPYSTTRQTVNGLRFLNAGPYIFTSIGARVDSLGQIPDFNFPAYRALPVNGIPFIPGDTLQVTVPGAVFPASAVSVRTAEAFTHGPIGVPAASADLPLSWTAAPGAGSQMTFSLRYANVFSTVGLNEQVFCSFNDDGAGTIPTRYLDGWRDALSGVRDSLVMRIRFREIVVDSRTKLSVISSFARPLFAASAPTLR